MKRKIIKIDQELCNGCGACLPNCPEGAIQIIDNKARLVSELTCDGLGACLGHCPAGAIQLEEREAEPYDEAKVMKMIAPQGENTILAHLRHLQDHDQEEYLQVAIEWLKSQGIALPSGFSLGEQIQEHHSHHGGCPGSAARDMRHHNSPNQVFSPTKIVSALQQWPVQLALLDPRAAFFDHAELLVSADCVPYAYGDFHRRFLQGKIAITFCPKLDHGIEEYVEKLAMIFELHDIKSITILRMEVPCCGGTTSIVEAALKKAGKQMIVKEYTIGIEGEIL